MFLVDYLKKVPARSASLAEKVPQVGYPPQSDCYCRSKSRLRGVYPPGSFEHRPLLSPHVLMGVNRQGIIGERLKLQSELIFQQELSFYSLSLGSLYGSAPAFIAMQSKNVSRYFRPLYHQIHRQLLSSSCTHAPCSGFVDRFSFPKSTHPMFL